MAAKKRTTAKTKRKPSPQAGAKEAIVLKTGETLLVCHGQPKQGQKPKITVTRLRRGHCIRIKAVGPPSGSSKSPDDK